MYILSPRWKKVVLDGVVYRCYTAAQRDGLCQIQILKLSLLLGMIAIFSLFINSFSKKVSREVNK
jgi:hypothetical protein